MSRIEAQPRDTLASRLGEARQAAGISQTELARRAGLTRAAICRIEHGEREASAETLRRLAPVLAVSTDWLLGLGGRTWRGSGGRAMKLDYDGLRIAAEGYAKQDAWMGMEPQAVLILLEERARYRQALEDILNPIAVLCRELKSGEQIASAAAEWADSSYTLRGFARKALEEP